MKVLRTMEPKTLIVVLEKENIDRIVAGDPIDFDTNTYFAGQRITVVVGYRETCPDNLDASEILTHISRGFHRTPEDGQKPRLIVRRSQ